MNGPEWNAEAYYNEMYENWYNRWQDFMSEYGIYLGVDCPVVKSELTIEVN